MKRNGRNRVPRAMWEEPVAAPLPAAVDDPVAALDAAQAHLAHLEGGSVSTSEQQAGALEYLLDLAVAHSGKQTSAPQPSADEIDEGKAREAAALAGSRPLRC